MSDAKKPEAKKMTDAQFEKWLEQENPYPMAIFFLRGREIHLYENSSTFGVIIATRTYADLPGGSKDTWTVSQRDFAAGDYFHVLTKALETQVKDLGRPEALAYVNEIDGTLQRLAEKVARRTPEAEAEHERKEREKIERRAAKGEEPPANGNGAKKSAPEAGAGVKKGVVEKFKMANGTVIEIDPAKEIRVANPAIWDLQKLNQRYGDEQKIIAVCESPTESQWRELNAVFPQDAKGKRVHSVELRQAGSIRPDPEPAAKKNGTTPAPKKPAPPAPPKPKKK